MEVKENIARFRLTTNKTEFPLEKITSAHSAQRFIRQFYMDDIEIFESAFILLLDRSNHTIGYAKISQGGVAGTVVDVKIVAKYAVDSLASGVILCHNHPSGNLVASEQDLKLTAKIKAALSLLDIQLHDHIILTSTAYNSLADSGDLAGM